MFDVVCESADGCSFDPDDRLSFLICTFLDGDPQLKPLSIVAIRAVDGTGISTNSSSNVHAAPSTNQQLLLTKEEISYVTSAVVIGVVACVIIVVAAIVVVRRRRRIARHRVFQFTPDDYDENDLQKNNKPTPLTSAELDDFRSSPSPPPPAGYTSFHTPEKVEAHPTATEQHLQDDEEDFAAVDLNDGQFGDPVKPAREF